MIGRKKKKHDEGEDVVVKKKQSRHLQRKLEARKPNARVDPHMEEQFLTGRLYACIESPGPARVVAAMATSLQVPFISCSMHRAGKIHLCVCR